MSSLPTSANPDEPATAPAGRPFPLALFTPPSTSTVPPPEPLTDAQKVKLKDMTGHFGRTDYVLAVNAGQGDGQEEKTGLEEREMMFLSHETLVRFLIGCKNNATEAITRLEECLIWRRTERIDDIDYMAEKCEEEIFMLERATDLMTDGVTKLLLMFDFAGERKGPPTSVSVARECLHILSHHYPEKLSLSIFLHVPLIAKIFINLMWPFVDANTKKKVRFGTDAVKDGDVEYDQLLKESGGGLDLPYDHATYWPALISTCKERREDHLKRWRSLGEPMVGREERLFKVSPGKRQDAPPDNGDELPAGAAIGEHQTE
ncbi:hypothetical protein P7C73_g1781, partial [Tremellales sp. Uapishka_1]